MHVSRFLVWQHGSPLRSFPCLQMQFCTAYGSFHFLDFSYHIIIWRNAMLWHDGSRNRHSPQLRDLGLGTLITESPVQVCVKIRVKFRIEVVSLDFRTYQWPATCCYISYDLCSPPERFAQSCNKRSRVASRSDNVTVGMPRFAIRLRIISRDVGLSPRQSAKFSFGFRE